MTAKKKKYQRKKNKKNRQGEGGGAPTKYKEEYCQMLIDHMSQGFSFESFGANIDVGRQTLWGWIEAHEKFSESKAIGDIKCLQFFEKAGQAIMTGMLKRVEEEEYARDDKGNVIFQDGKPVVARRKFAQTKGDSKVWSLSMKNKFRWVEPIQLSGKITTTNMKDPAEMSDEELDKELEKYGK